MTAYRTIEIGLPFYGDINKQMRYKPYYNSAVKELIYPIGKLPYFQFYGYEGASGLTDFDLINVDTGAITSFLAHFNSYGGTTNVGDIDKYYYYANSQAASLVSGRYYFYAKDDLSQEWWSEIFVARDLDIDVNANPEFREIEIGLPFFDNINKQIRNKPYYNSSIREWLTASNRFPNFQISISEASIPTMSVFSLINADTGDTSDQLVYFNANVINIDRDVLGYYWTHMGLTDVVVDEGRYYFYAKNADDIEWWSEVFVMCGNITKSTDYLLLDNTDYLLIGSTDKLIIG